MRDCDLKSDGYAVVMSRWLIAGILMSGLVAVVQLLNWPACKHCGSAMQHTNDMWICREPHEYNEPTRKEGE